MIACHSLISRTAPFSVTVVDAGLIHRVPERRQQVGRVTARVVERLDLRLEGLTLLVLGHKRQFALGVFRDGHEDQADHQRAGEAIQALVFSARCRSRGSRDRGLPISMAVTTSNFGRDGS